MPDIPAPVDGFFVIDKRLASVTRNVDVFESPARTSLIHRFYAISGQIPVVTAQLR
jgi:hypothetical protein